MISKEKLDLAVRQVVDVCLRAKNGEGACIITDNETKHIGLPISEYLKKVTGDIKVFIMEDFGSRPEDGVNPLPFPKIVGDILSVVDVSVYAASGKKNEYKSFRKPMLEIIKNNKKLRHGHMIGVTDEIMETGMAVDYKEVQKITGKIFDIVSKARQIKVTTSAGTNVVAEFDPALKWVSFDGNIKPGHWCNLPDGEVFTCPENINGKFIVDGVLGDYMSKFGTLEKYPLYVELKDSRAINVTCENKEIEAEVNSYIVKEENANRIGEFAVGTNIGLKKLIGNLLQDEKFPGIHMAFGHPYPDETGAKWDASAHLDMVIRNANIEIDGKQVMKSGVFLI